MKERIPRNKGTINDRFILRYNNNPLKNNEFEDLSNEIKIFTNNNVNITSSNSAIENIIIYNGLGKTLLKKSNISKQELVLTELIPTSNMIIVKVTLNNKKVVIKKVVF